MQGVVLIIFGLVTLVIGDGSDRRSHQSHGSLGPGAFEVASLAQRVLTHAATDSLLERRPSAFLEVTRHTGIADPQPVQEQTSVVTFLDLYTKRDFDKLLAESPHFNDVIAQNIAKALSQVLPRFGGLQVKQNGVQILDMLQSSSEKEPRLAVKYRFQAPRDSTLKAYVQSGPALKEALNGALSAAFAQTHADVIAKVSLGSEAFAMRPDIPSYAMPGSIGGSPMISTPPSKMMRYISPKGAECNPTPKQYDTKPTLESALYLWQDFDENENEDDLMCNEDFTAAVRSSILAGMSTILAGTGSNQAWDVDRVRLKSVELSNGDLRTYQRPVKEGPEESALQQETRIGIAAQALSGGAVWIGKASPSPWPQSLNDRLSVTYEIYVDDADMGEKISRLVFEGSQRSSFEQSFVSTYRSSPGPYGGRKVHVEQTKLITGADPSVVDYSTGMDAVHQTVGAYH